MTADTFLTLDFWFEMARGPFVWISLVIGFLGSVHMTLKVLAATNSRQPLRQQSRRIPKKPPWYSREWLTCLATQVRYSVLGTYPLVMAVSVTFHVLLFAVPLFLLAHNILLEDSLGFGLWSMTQEASDAFTWLFLACVLFFLVRRMVSPRVRAITTLSDYGVLVMTAAPFVTGLLALYQIGDYRLMLTLHMLSGELMLLLAPFTKVFHMVFFFLGRFVLVSEHTLGRGSRTW